MKKTRGLYHVSEGRYLNFSPVRFSEIVAILTAPAVLINVLDFLHGTYLNDNFFPIKIIAQLAMDKISVLLHFPSKPKYSSPEIV
jgi:hypothetical protein